MSSNDAKQHISMPAKRTLARGGLGAAAHASGNGSEAANNNNGTAANATTVRQSMPLEAATLNTLPNGMTRLTPARDLTLGGRGGGGATKKVFAPNLNAVRNKNTNVKTSKDFTAPRGGRRGARGGAGIAGSTRGRGGNSSLIQTTGVFSEGAGAVHLRKSTGNGSSYARAGEEVAVARKRSERKQDEKSAQLRNLIEDDGTSEEDDVASDNELEADKTELANKPIVLKEGLWRTNKPQVKDETTSIQNIGTMNEDSVAVAQHMQNLFVEAQAATMEEPPLQFGRYPRSIGAFLDAPHPQIFLMQLPDILPCVVDEATEPVAAKEEAEATTSSEAPASPLAGPTTNTPKESVLKQLEEGQIGKIVRYRSGRVQLVLGEVRFDLEMGLDTGFLQELMSVTTDREQRSGSMINLGPIQAKLKATPDWQHLFEQKDKDACQQSSATTPTTDNNNT